MNENQYSYEEQRMLSEYQQHTSSGRNESSEQLLLHYQQQIASAQKTIRSIYLSVLIGPCFFTLITSFACVIEPQMVGVELSKFTSHVIMIVLFFRINQELNEAKQEILGVPKDQLKLLFLSYEKNVYDFLEEFKFQEKFDILNVLVYSSQIWSFFFSQLIFLLPIKHQGIYILLMISYTTHMLLYSTGCIISCFRQNPKSCECSLLKSKTGYQFINLPKLEDTKRRTMIVTTLLLFYYIGKFLLFLLSFHSSELETHVVIIANLIYCGLMIIKQIYQLFLANMIQKVNGKHLICFQNAYMLYFKLFFYNSICNVILKSFLFFASLACIIMCFMFNAKKYFTYLESSIYKIEIYLVNDTICFVISICIYIYYIMKKYTIKTSLNNIESQDDQNFDMRFYSLNQQVMNPYYRVLSDYLELEQKNVAERNQREIMRKLQISPDKSIDIDENSECVICTEKMNVETHLVGLACHPSHVFHKECLIKWVLLHTTCPTCRSPIQ